MPTYVGIRNLNRSDSLRLLTVNAVAAPTSPGAVGADTGGSLATATYYYKITALGANGESLPTSEVNSGARTGPNASVTLTWTASTGATGYRVYRGTSTGAESVYMTVGAVTTLVDTGSVATTSGTVPGTGSATSVPAWTNVSATVTSIVNVDDGPSRKALNSHRAIGQFIVVASNNTIGSTALPPNS